MPCSHTSWLRLSDKNHEISLQVSDRPKRLLAAVGSKRSKSSSLVLLIGNHQKAEAIRKLGIAYRSESGQRGHADIHLFIAPKDRFSSPTIVADGDLPIHNRAQSRSPPSRCHEMTHSSLSSSDGGRQKTSQHAEMVYHRLLLPFADVVCLFLDDLGGVNLAARKLAAWLNYGRASSGSVLPWLLLVAEDGRGENNIIAEFERGVRDETSISLLTRFQGVQAVSLSARSSPRCKQRYKHRQWHKFQDELLHLIECATETRIKNRYLYSMEHLVAFLQHATTLLSSWSGPFNFISVSRAQHPIGADLELHLSNFLDRISSVEDFKTFALPVIASSFILDHYSPRMHRKYIIAKRGDSILIDLFGLAFDPSEVFAELYQQTCTKIRRRTFHSDDGSSHLVLPSTFVKLMKTELQQQFRLFLETGSASAQHQHQLTSFQSHWRRLYSEDTCYSCMMRRPKYKLPCGHWVCDICMKIFGTKKNVYLSLDNCPLCGGHGIRIRFKPDTATVRVLCIDGGGTRACVPLRFLQELEARVGLPYPVQCNFDILFGTSSGAISICGLGVKGWSVNDCIATSKALARAVFRPRRVASLPLAWIPSIHRIWQTILSVLLDSRYPSRNIEAALKKVFGSSRNIADFSLATEMGLHIGMPVTATNDTSTHLVTNYNGVGKRNQDGDYQILQTEDNNVVPLWKALRATTAAPYFFAPQDIGGRQYQDGGVGPYNNPAGLAYAETAALFPDTPQPSLVASFGTGSSGGKQMDKTKPPATISRRFNPSKVTKPRKKNRRRSWSDLFVFRIFQAFLSHGDSTRAWKQLLSQRAEQSGGEFFRFDVQYDGSAPSLDNITDLDEMEELAEECIMASPSLDRLALCIRAQNFYFELDGEPQYSNGLYECAGHIFCRLEPGSEEHSAFLESLDSSSSHFQVGSKLLSGTFLQESARGQNNAFSKQIKFCVHGRQVPFEIVLREGFEEASNISGSPFTIDQLVKAQKIDARFGTADHRP